MDLLTLLWKGWPCCCTTIWARRRPSSRFSCAWSLPAHGFPCWEGQSLLHICLFSDYFQTQGRKSTPKKGKILQEPGMTRSKAVSYVLKRVSLNPRRPLLKLFDLCLNIFIFSSPSCVAACALPPKTRNSPFVQKVKPFFFRWTFLLSNIHPYQDIGQNSIYIKILCWWKASLEVSLHASFGAFGVSAFLRTRPNSTATSAYWDVALASRWTSWSRLNCFVSLCFPFFTHPKKSFTLSFFILFDFFWKLKPQNGNGN